LREAIQSKIHQLGSRLDNYPHHRLSGRAEYRLRVGDYRVMYGFNREENILYVLAIGNRREIYR
jgi:mRNA interferase RelE/StbE